MPGIYLTMRLANRDRRVNAINRQQAFLDAYVDAWGDLRQALAASGIPRGTWARWTQTDAGFRQQYSSLREALRHGEIWLGEELTGTLIGRALGSHPGSGGVPDAKALIAAMKLVGAPRFFGRR